jgi:hypothetical protein
MATTAIAGSSRAPALSVPWPKNSRYFNPVTMNARHLLDLKHNLLYGAQGAVLACLEVKDGNSMSKD